MRNFGELKKRFVFDIHSKIDHLGDGGFGRVYRAYDNEKSKYVALKIVHLKISEIEKFSLKREYRLAKKIENKSNIAIYEEFFRLRTETGFVDIAVMQYYPEGNLNKYLYKKPLEEKARRQIIWGLINGLEQAHKLLIHRDLKPANVLIAIDPDMNVVPKISDFGISKKANLANPYGQVSNSVIGGTMSYNSPEQIINGKESSHIKFNSDLWSFGVIAYELYKGVNPFAQGIDPIISEDERKSIIRQRILSNQLPDDIESIPEPYSSIVKKCLVFDPELRINKAEEIKEIIETHDIINSGGYTFSESINVEDGEQTIIITKSKVSFWFATLVLGVLTLLALLLVGPKDSKIDKGYYEVTRRAEKLVAEDSIQVAINLLNQVQAEIGSDTIKSYINKLNAIRSKKLDIIYASQIHQLKNSDTVCDGERVKLYRKIGMLDSARLSPWMKSLINKCK